MDAESLQYPVIAFSGPYFEIRRSPEQLTTDYWVRIRDGHFDGMTIVDRTGRSFRVAKVVPPRVGILRRLVERITTRPVRVHLELAEGEDMWDVERVRTAVRREFSSWDGWQSRDDHDDVMRGVAAATTPAELIDLLERAGRGGV